LLEAVYAANPKTVLVLMSAGPLSVTWAQDHLPAILSAWYPGESGGTAIARALFGVDNPGGHLPYTVYASLDGVPPQNEYDVSKGFTYQYFKGIPLYPFGFGLSYTRFEFSHLEVKPPTPGPADDIEISFQVRNAGDRAGSEVAQVYTHQGKSAVYQPIRSLRSFRRLQLQPGESKTVELRIPAKELAYYDAQKHTFVTESGVYDVQVGGSSDDIRLRGTVQITPGSQRR
jgi:beta-glucosidase